MLRQPSSVTRVVVMRREMLHLSRYGFESSAVSDDGGDARITQTKEWQRSLLTSVFPG